MTNVRRHPKHAAGVDVGRKDDTVGSVALPHREGVVEEVEVRTIVAVKWDDGGRSNHAAGALQAAPFTSATKEKKT